MAVSVNDMVAATSLAVTGVWRVEVTAKDTAREVWILLDDIGRKQTQKRPKHLFFQDISAFIGRHGIINWWAHQDSNLEPKDYE
ncbi:hypothetical protein, partial [Stenotrophomonas bentonitica]|uniref:hypothetical protein n=1 Tax=Stenotrophomonas bentonitica TaxID=1450134 RepID=UPI0031B9D3E4